MKPLRLLHRLEGSLERAIEGTINRVFKPAIQPAEIARRLAREMASKPLLAMQGQIVPNHFEVWVSQADAASFGGGEAAIAQYLEEWLDGEADRLGFLTVGPVSVVLHPDPAIRPRGLRIESSIREGDVPPQRQAPQFGETQPFAIQRPAPALSTWRLEVISGPLAGIAHAIRKRETSLGRALDNDFIVDSPDVSRRHALVELRDDALVAIDLGSLNGTFVNGRRIIDRAVLRDGDRLSLGLLDLSVTYGAR
jgi:hypothetical protein